MHIPSFTFPWILLSLIRHSTRLAERWGKCLGGSLGGWCYKSALTLWMAIVRRLTVEAFGTASPIVANGYILAHSAMEFLT